MYDSFEVGPEKQQDLSGFFPMFIFLQAIGLVCMILTGYWMGTFWQGYSWSDRRVFNYHPLLMVIGLIVLYGDAILLYRILRVYPKKWVKLAHAALNGLAFFFSVVGMTAAFKAHDLQGIPNMYSLHSWIGLLVVLLFACQWVLGLTTYVYPGASEATRARLLPFHRAIGLFLFVCALVACISGITEKNFFTNEYSKKTTGTMLSNFLGLFLTAFVGLVFYLIHNPAYRRMNSSPSLDPIIQSR